MPAWGDLDGNITRLAQAAEKVSQDQVDHAVFPETAVSGYLFSGPQQLAPFVDTIPGRTTAALLPILQRTGMHMSVGIAERDAATGLVYNTAVLLGPGGIIGKYRKNGLNPQDQKVFAPGTTGVEVFDTPIGRIGLASAEELGVPELGGLYGALRTDIVAAPAGRPQSLKVLIDAKLFAVNDPPTGRADFFPYASAKPNQLWLVSGGWRIGDATAAAIYGPEPIVETSTLTAGANESILRYRTHVPAPGTWINQQQLIAGQQAL